MRNVGEHLAEHIAGAGQLQARADPTRRRGEQRSLGVMIWTGAGDHGTHLTWAGTHLDVTTARVAADRLFEVICEAVDRWTNATNPRV